MRPAAATFLTFLLLGWPSAQADEISPSTGEKKSSIILDGTSFDPPSLSPGNSTRDRPAGTSERPKTIIELCTVYSTGEIDCPEAAPIPAAAPQLTLGQVVTAVREIPMPRLEVQVQPGERTLVNVDTIFYTEPTVLRRSVDLLGHDIDVEATASGFTWHHGDGTTASTRSPGRPYPAKDVTHAYTRTADTVRPRVDAAYTVRYRVDRGAWTPLGETLTATGPTTALRVDEAAPVLSRP